MHVVLVGPEFEENLSLRYLAAALRRAGHTASLARFDSPEYVDGVVSQVRRERPGLVGLSLVFQVRAREFYELARALRQVGYQGHVTAGGHFATFAHEPILQDLLELDSVVRQEGEETIVELADALQRGAGTEELAKIAGLVVRGPQGEILVAPPRRQVDDLDTLPFPARDTLPELHLGVPTAYLVGSRGCYAHCDYCCIIAWHEAALGKRYRMRRAAHVAEEMEWLYHERGVRFFVFHDDNFFLPTAAGSRQRFAALRAEIRQHKLDGIGLMLKLRPNDGDRENLLLLKDLGLLRVFIGVENASPRQLRSLGREATVEQMEAGLALLRELDVYATYNLLLFNPTTTLDDVALNLRFVRRHLFFPFNWCKVEPYAGTALERRLAAEGRLRGDYLGGGYEIADPRVRLMYELLLPAFYYRNFDYYGLANLNIGLGHHRQLLRHFYPDRAAPDLCERGQRLIEAINADALSLLERTYEFVREVNLDRRAEIARFGEQLQRDAFHGQHALSEQAEVVLREMERAAGVRQESPARITEAFTPLAPPVVRGSAPPDKMGDGRWVMDNGSDSGQSQIANRKSQIPWMAFTRRGVLAALGSGLVWLLTGCRRRPSAPSPPPTPSAAKATTPQATIRVAEGHPDTVAAWEQFMLEAILEPDEVQVIGEPRVTCSDGEIKSVQAGHGKRRLLIEYQPGGGQKELDPNVTITAAWTVRGEEADTVVVARAFVHVNGDGSYTFGYEIPRPMAPEMVAPPIAPRPRR